MSNAVRPPTAYVDRDEYGCFTVYPTSLVVTAGVPEIRFVNLTALAADVQLPAALKPSKACLELGPNGGVGTVKVRLPRKWKSYPYRVRVGDFEGRGGSGPKVIVDP